MLLVLILIFCEKKGKINNFNNLGVYVMVMYFIMHFSL